MTGLFPTDRSERRDRTSRRQAHRDHLEAAHHHTALALRDEFPARARRDQRERLDRPAHAAAPRHGSSGRTLRGVVGLATAGLAASALANYGLARRAVSAAPPRGRFVASAACRLHVYERGQGSSVVLLHGLGTSLDDFVSSGLFAALGQQFRVSAVDRPGYGHSDRPRDRVWTAEEQARVIRNALVHRNGTSERVVLVGHSWGALVAIAWALQHPGEVSGLVLLSPYLYPTPRTDIVMMTPPVIPVLGDILRYSVMPWVNRLTVPAMYKRMFAPLAVPGRYYEDVPVELAVRPLTIRAIAEDAALMMPTADRLQHHYDDLRMPISLLAGASDAVTDPHRHSERFGEEIGNATARLLPGIGHMVHFSAHEQVMREVASIAGEPRAAHPPLAERADAIR
jgi:pimeloyl-ACP methyl ester carboxylesterase